MRRDDRGLRRVDVRPGLTARGGGPADPHAPLGPAEIAHRWSPSLPADAARTCRMAPPRTAAITTSGPLAHAWRHDCRANRGHATAAGAPSVAHVLDVHAAVGGACPHEDASHRARHLPDGRRALRGGHDPGAGVGAAVKDGRVRSHDMPRPRPSDGARRVAHKTCPVSQLAALPAVGHRLPPAPPRLCVGTRPGGGLLVGHIIVLHPPRRSLPRPQLAQPNAAKNAAARSLALLQQRETLRQARSFGRRMDALCRRKAARGPADCCGACTASAAHSVQCSASGPSWRRPLFIALFAGAEQVFAHLWAQGQAVVEWNVSNGPSFDRAQNDCWEVLIGWLDSGLVGGLLVHAPPDARPDDNEHAKKLLVRWHRRAQCLVAAATRLIVPAMLLGPRTAQWWKKLPPGQAIAAREAALDTPIAVQFINAAAPTSATPTALANRLADLRVLAGALLRAITK